MPTVFKSDEVAMVVLPMAEYEAMKAELADLRSRKYAPTPDIDDIMFMGIRVYAILDRMGIRNVSDIQKFSRNDFVRQKGLGKKSLAEIEGLMKVYGLKYCNELNKDGNTSL